MPYSELKPGRLRLEDELTGTAYLIIQKGNDLLWCDVSENILQVLTNIKSGTLALRPAAGEAGRLYFATDTKELYRDDGTTWIRVVSGETGIYDADRDTYINVEPSSDADKIVGYAAGAQVLNISNAGIVSFAKQSACKAYLSANQSITANTWTIVAFDTVEFDRQGEFNTTNHRFTATETGVYLLAANLRFISSASASTDMVFGRIVLNASTLLSVAVKSKGATDTSMSFSVIATLNPGDYIYVDAMNQNHDDTIMGHSACTYLCAAKIA